MSPLRFVACAWLLACGPGFTTGEASDLARDASGDGSGFVVDSSEAGSSKDSNTSTDASSPLSAETSSAQPEASAPDASSDSGPDPAAVPDGGACVVITPGFGCPGAGFVYMQHCGSEVQCCNWPSPVCP
jgi:hypothetical protein